MKNVNFFHYRLTKTNFSKITLSALIVLIITIVPVFGQMSPTTLSLADILIGLRSKKATLPEKNKLLTEAVIARGITFAVTDEIEKELEKTGATVELLQAIRQKKTVSKPTAAPSPAPIPVAAVTFDYAYYQNKANAFFVKGDYNAAVLNYNKALELNPKDTVTYLSRGLTYYNTKFYDLAVNDFTKAIELAPKDSMSFFKRGDSYERMGNVEKAIADYKNAIALDPENKTAKTYLERLQSEQEKLSPKPPTTEAVAETKKEPVPVAEKTLPKTVNVGSLNSLAVKLEIPAFPAIERQRQNFGLVTVQISLDNTGKVVSAKASDGPAGLRNSAETAARRSKFKPAMFDGQPVTTNGFITYNFKP